MPNLGSDPQLQGVTYDEFPAYIDIGYNISVPSASYRTVKSLDLTWDLPAEDEVIAGQGIPSLSDWEGSGWRLRRIVGRLDQNFIGADETSQSYLPFLLGAGFMVCKVQPDGTLPRPDEDYDPLTIAGIRDPWIWRRTWKMTSLPWSLRNAAIIEPHYSAVDGTVGLSSIQATGSGLTGGVIDQKTNRRINTEERLFFFISAHHLQYDVDKTIFSNVTLDYRLLGSVMKNTNRRNASR